MAKLDFRVKNGSRFAAQPYYTKASATPIVAGELVIQGSGGDSRYVVLPSNGASNSSNWVGLAVSNDTANASTGGIVYVVDALDATFIGKATTFSNVSASVMNTKVTLDVANGVQTLDEDDTTNGVFLMTNFDSAKKEVYFKIDASNRLNS